MPKELTMEEVFTKLKITNTYGPAAEKLFSEIVQKVRAVSDNSSVTLLDSTININMHSNGRANIVVAESGSYRASTSLGMGGLASKVYKKDHSGLFEDYMLVNVNNYNVNPNAFTYWEVHEHEGGFKRLYNEEDYSNPDRYLYEPAGELGLTEVKKLPFLCAYASIIAWMNFSGAFSR